MYECTYLHEYKHKDDREPPLNGITVLHKCFLHATFL